MDHPQQKNSQFEGQVCRFTTPPKPSKYPKISRSRHPTTCHPVSIARCQRWRVPLTGALPLVTPKIPSGLDGVCQLGNWRRCLSEAFTASEPRWRFHSKMWKIFTQRRWGRCFGWFNHQVAFDWPTWRVDKPGPGNGWKPGREDWGFSGISLSGRTRPRLKHGRSTPVVVSPWMGRNDVGVTRPSHDLDSH